MRMTCRSSVRWSDGTDTRVGCRGAERASLSDIVAAANAQAQRFDRACLAVFGKFAMPVSATPSSDPRCAQGGPSSPGLGIFQIQSISKALEFTNMRIDVAFPSLADDVR